MSSHQGGLVGRLLTLHPWSCFFFSGGLIAITCSFGLMLHAGLPKLHCNIAYHRWIAINWFAGQQWHIFGNLNLALFPVACLVQPPDYVEQINAHECWNMCIVNFGTICATRGVWCMCHKKVVDAARSSIWVLIGTCRQSGEGKLSECFV